MPETPAFFIPGATPEIQESTYAGFAKWCNRPIPRTTERIYSITFRHDNGEWTATVGQTLRGISRRFSRSRGKKTERKEFVTDPAVVLAIFPGEPCMVITNHQLSGNVGSLWANPFMIGQIDVKSITLFANPITPVLP